MTGRDLQPKLTRPACTFGYACQRRFDLASLRGTRRITQLGVASSAYLDLICAHSVRGFNLRHIGIDKDADQHAGLRKLASRLLNFFFARRDVEPALGRHFI